MEWRYRAFILNRASSTALESSWPGRILSLQGRSRVYPLSTSYHLFLIAKPGFGKTVLSASIIDDLSLRTWYGFDPGEYRPSVAFFHIEKGELTRRECSQALRAVAIQLLHLHHLHRLTIDALTLLNDTQLSGQQQASGDDVEAGLRLLLYQFPTMLVFAWVYECVDSELFLTKLYEMSGDVDVKIILLSRPDL